jgi:hypothetical protein
MNVILRAGNLKLTSDNLESAVFARLELDPQSSEYVPRPVIYSIASDSGQP